MPKVTIKQRDITDCGAACLASIAAHYRLKTPVFKIRQLASTDKRGTNIRGMLEAAEKLGFQAKGVRGVKESLHEIPKPSVAHVELPNGLHHFVVIYKVTQSKVEIMDPGDGRMHSVSMDEFLKIWTGVLVLLVPGEQFEKGDDTVSVWRRFMYLIEPHRSILLQSLFGAVIATLLGLSSAIYVQKIVDSVIPAANKGLLNVLSVGMILILVFQIFIGVTRSVFMLVTAQQIDARLILGYYKHLLQLPQRFFDSMKVGEITSRIGDAVKIRSFINDVSVGLVVDALTVVFSFVLMVIYSWKLTIIMLGLIPIYIIIFIALNALNRKFLRKLMETGAELEGQLVESINSIETIKRFGIEDFANMKTETRFVQMLRVSFSAAKVNMFSTNSLSFATRLFTILLLWIGTYSVLGNEITPGILLSFHALIGHFTGPLQNLVASNTSIQNALIAADRLFELMDLEREENQGNIDLNSEMLGDIKIKNLTFRYGSRANVFEDFSMTLKQGQMTAIVGESGSGKTTIISVLQKMYPLESGEVYFGDYELSSIRRESLRQVVGVVPQKIDLFGGSVVENIALGEFEPDLPKITRICEQLDILGFIEKLPDGFGTNLGERGVALSGGQQQRIAIARALYKNPDVLILDEATSHLDTISENVVFKTISMLREQGKTIIVIAHRLSTIRNADTIALLEEGKLIEEGTLDGLIDQKGAFYDLWKEQYQV